ncbi:ArnT family glycosyltransferase [Kitasatospora sp. HPMI-4]|uniref:ArnT family glycosyltransferase n=1 Tax=Kitasatospora sp. HPMI-4 TaxID=3448443 RepID=UPI003F1AF9C6
MTSVKYDPPPAIARAEPPAPSTARATGPQRWALAGICLLAGWLYLWSIGSGSGDFGNAYYSAAVRSMTRSPENFLFGAFDPYGLVSTDKPPMSLWPQAVSVLLFGFHSWSVLLPQAIEGLATVLLLHRTVRLWAGENVALLAALVLALTPVTVAIDRDNNTDTLLVLLLVAAAYALTRSVATPQARRRTGWLMLCAFLIGCGFVTKWLAAWIIVPGFTLAFLVSARGPLRRRTTDLLAAGAVLAVSSFWWPVLHDLWPGRKPFVDAGTDGSALQVVFGYNGFGKIFDFGQRYNGSGLNVALGMVGMGGGNPDVTRMFSTEVGGQISWLLPLSLLVLAVVGTAGYRRLWFRIPGDPLQRAGWLMWGTWLGVTGLVFSFVQGIWHPYYTAMLAPAVAAVSAAGIALLRQRYRESDGYGWTLLPAAVAITALWAFVLVSRNTTWNGWARWAVLAVAAVAVAGLVLGRLPARPARRRSAVERPAVVLGVAAMLLTTAVWSAGTAIDHGTNGGFPSAGPPNRAFDALLRGVLPPALRNPATTAMPGGAPMPGGMPTAPMAAFPTGPARGGGIGGPDLSPENRKVLDYAVRNSDGARIALAVEGGGLAASSFIIRSDATVVGMGGYLGADDVPSVDQLRTWVAGGELRFVLSAAPGGPRLGGLAGMGGDVQRLRVTWVQRNCQAVDPAVYGGTPAAPDGQPPVPSFADETLYRCDR